MLKLRSKLSELMVRIKEVLKVLREKTIVWVAKKWSSSKCQLCMPCAINIITLLGVVASCLAAYFFWAQLKVMEDANKDATKTFIVANRPYVFLEKNGHQPIVYQSVLSDWIVNPAFRNSGKTPAFHTTCWGDKAGSEAEVMDDIQRASLNSSGYYDIGPGSLAICPPIHFSEKELDEIWKKNKRVFIWTRVEYSDSFPGTPRYHTQICSEVEVVSDPALPIDTSNDASSIMKHRVAFSECNNAN